MGDLRDMCETLELLMRRADEFREWLPSMEVTLVEYKCEDSFQAFQSNYYREHGEHFCYTLTDWLSLDREAKQELVGKKVMLIKPRSERIGLGGALLFLSKRFYSQRGKEFVAIKDALGASGVPYTPSFSY